MEKMNSFQEKITYNFLGLIISVIFLVITIVVIRNYKPVYTESDSAVEYMWGKMSYLGTKKIIVPGDTTLWISSHINTDPDIYIRRRVFVIKVYIQNIQRETFYFEEYMGIWDIDPNKKEQDLIKLAYEHF